MEVFLLASPKAQRKHVIAVSELDLADKYFCVLHLRGVEYGLREFSSCENQVLVVGEVRKV